MSMTSQTPISLFLSRLYSPKEYGDKWRAPCPSCNGSRKDTLLVSMNGDGSVWAHCFAGCRISDVVKSVGLNMRDLRPFGQSTFSRKKGRVYSEKAALEAREKEAFYALMHSKIQLNYQKEYGGEILVIEEEVKALHRAYDDSSKAKDAYRRKKSMEDALVQSTVPEVLA